MTFHQTATRGALDLMDELRQELEQAETNARIWWDKQSEEEPASEHRAQAEVNAICASMRVELLKENIEQLKKDITNQVFNF